MPYYGGASSGLTQAAADALYEAKDAAIQAHVVSAHAPSNAQKNSDITKAEIEAKLTGEIASHTHAGGGGITLADVYKVGDLYITTVGTNPATRLGFGTWAAFGAGRVLVGLDSGDANFDTVEETGGAKTVAAAGSNSAPTFAGTPFTDVINHSHAVNVTDPGHTHTQASQTATTGGASSWEHGVIDTSSTAAETLPTGSNTTGITATTANPAGGVASITPAGTVSAPTFTGSATSVVQPYIVVYMFKRTA